MLQCGIVGAVGAEFWPVHARPAALQHSFLSKLRKVLAFQRHMARERCGERTYNLQGGANKPGISGNQFERPDEQRCG